MSDNQSSHHKIKPIQCPICHNVRTLDSCHIKSKGSGGGDEDSNKVYMCRLCHSESHQLGWLSFCRKHPIAAAILESKGWYFEDVFGVMKLHRD